MIYTQSSVGSDLKAKLAIVTDVNTKKRDQATSPPPLQSHKTSAGPRKNSFQISVEAKTASLALKSSLGDIIIIMLIAE